MSSKKPRTRRKNSSDCVLTKHDLDPNIFHGCLFSRSYSCDRVIYVLNTFWWIREIIIINEIVNLHAIATFILFSNRQESAEVVSELHLWENRDDLFSPEITILRCFNYCFLVYNCIYAFVLKPNNLSQFITHFCKICATVGIPVKTSKKKLSYTWSRARASFDTWPNN